MPSQDDLKKATEELIEAVKTNANGAYDKWVELDQKIAALYGAWVQEVTSLKHPPTAEEMEYMHQHSAATLKDKVQQMREARPEGPVCAGNCVST